MNEQISTVGITIPEEGKLSSGIGYIALPKDIDRLTYIKDCFQNFRVSIHTAHDGFMNRVQISEADLNFIDFPTDCTKMGTAVYYITDPITEQPYIIKWFKSTKIVGTGQENQFKMTRIYKGSVVEIAGNPEKGYLNLLVNNDKNAELKISVTNKNNNGKLNLEVAGSLNVICTNDTSFVQNGQWGSKVFDPQNSSVNTEIIQRNNNINFNSSGHNNFIQNEQFYSKTVDSDDSSTKTEIIQYKDEVDINTPSLVVNNGEEPLALANKLKSFMNDFIQEIGNSKVITMFGASPLLNSFQIFSYTQRTDEFISSVIFTNK